MYFDKTYLGQNKPLDFYVAKPNRKLISKINGMRTSSQNMILNFVDLSEFSFDVYETVYDKKTNKQIPNKSYEYLKIYMYIKASNDIWFRISEEPTVHIDESGRYKSVRCQSLECELMDKDIVSLVVNMANELSMEWYDENLSPIGSPISFITFVNETNPKLSLMGLILSYAPNWKIGHIDTELRDMKRSLEISSSTVYSVLTQDIAKAFRCIFIFNSNTRTINAYKVENVGNDTNIYLSIHTLINENVISPSSNDIYTQFTVMADDNKDILPYVNFGSNVITNYDYFMNGIWFTPEAVTKYETYKTNVDTKRARYIELTQLWNDLNIEKTDKVDRKPLDECSNTWVGLTLEDLTTELNSYQAALNYLIELHTKDGVLVISESADYATYLSFKDVIIPKLQAQIEAVIAGKIKPDEELDWEHNWELFGITELTTRRDVYLNKMDSLKLYVEPYNPNDPTINQYDETYYKAQHDLYLEYAKCVTDINSQLSTLESEKAAIETSMQSIQTERSQIVSYVRIDNSVHGFTADELSTIESLTIHTDYVNENILVTEYDDTLAQIELAKELYESSKEELYEESRPQLTISTTLQNFISISKYNDFTEQLEAGNFIRVGLNSDSAEKLRVTSIEFNPGDLTENMSINFSNITIGYNKQDDYTYLLDDAGGGSSKNSISAGITSSDITTAISSLLNLKFSSFVNSSTFTNATYGSIEATMGVFNTILSNYLKTKNLDVEIGNISQLTSDSAFITYLQTQFASITNLDVAVGDIEQLTSSYAEIVALLSGTTTTGSLHTIVLNATNATIDSAFFKQLIADNATVSDFKAGDITLSNQMRILSENGKLLIDGETMQFLDANGNVGVQIGYNAMSVPSILIKDSNGTALWTSTGITKDAIADGTIIKNMIEDNAVDKDKVDWGSAGATTDAEGKPIWNSSYVTVDENGTTVTEKLTQVQTSMDETKGEVTQLISDTTVAKEDGTTVKLKDDYNLTKDTVDSHTQALSSHETLLGNQGTEIEATKTQMNTVVQDLDSTKSTISSIQTSVTEAENAATEAKEKADAAIISVIEEYAISESPNTVPTEEWSVSSPDYVRGTFIWRRMTTTYGSGRIDVGAPSLITGNDGEDAVLLRIDSSRGTVFKNNSISTVLSVVIYKGSERITDIIQLHEVFGTMAYLEWSWQRIDDETFGIISSTDKMIKNDGFALAISADEVDAKVTFQCELKY